MGSVDTACFIKSSACTLWVRGSENEMEIASIKEKIRIA